MNLHDIGVGVGDDLQARDFIFSNIFPGQSTTAGESSGFVAVPVINGYTREDSVHVRYLLNAVTYYSSQSAVGDERVSVNETAILTRDSVDGLILEIRYIFEENIGRLTTFTSFLDESVGDTCGHSESASFLGYDTPTDRTQLVQVALGDSFAANAWSADVTVDMHAGWYVGSDHPALITVSTASMDEDGAIVLHNNAVTFVFDPEPGLPCEGSPIAQAVVQVNPNSGEVTITIFVSS